MRTKIVIAFIIQLVWVVLCLLIGIGIVNLAFDDLQQPWYGLLCGLIALVIYFILWNPTARRIRDINRLLNKDRTVCDFIVSLDGWNISPTETDGLKTIITPIGMPRYSLYITYKGERPSNAKIKELHYELTNINSSVSKAHKMNIPFEQYLDIETAASLRIIDMRRYRKYKEWYDEHLRLMTQYGVHSTEANEYFNSFHKHINFPNEWRAYQEYRLKQK